MPCAAGMRPWRIPAATAAHGPCGRAGYAAPAQVLDPLSPPPALTLAGVALCGRAGDDVLDVDEALSFLALQQNFTPSLCNRNIEIGYVVIFCMGLGWRLLAFAQMLYQAQQQYFEVRRGRCAGLPLRAA